MNDIKTILDIFIFLLYLIIVNFVTIYFYINIYRRNNYKNNLDEDKNILKNESNNKKILLKKISKILLITCNTFLYCVLYNKVRNISIVYLIIYTLYFLLLIYISMYDIKYKKIKNTSNIYLSILSIIMYILDYKLIHDKIILHDLFINIGIRIIIVLIIFLLLVLLRKILRNNIGGGDIKMLSALMLYMPLDRYIFMIIICNVTSLIYALYLLLIKKKHKDYKFSYGEFISLSTIITIIYGGN